MIFYAWHCPLYMKMIKLTYSHQTVIGSVFSDDYGQFYHCLHDPINGFCTITDNFNNPYLVETEDELYKLMDNPFYKYNQLKLA